MVSRLAIQRMLGAIWLLDGLLQLKPKMFTSAFSAQIILPMASGQPHWLAALVIWGARLVAPDASVYNVGFALAQLALGTLLLLDIWRRWSLAGSVAWAVFVWVFGEGLGGLLAHGALLVSGAPGPGLLYALVSVAVWPVAGAPLAWQTWTARFSQLALGTLWALGCVLLLEVSPGGLARSLAFPGAARIVRPLDPVATAGLLVVEGALAVLLFANRHVIWTVRCSLLLAALFWWLGQDFGQIWTALGTDVNSGPLLMFLAVAAAPEAPGRWFVGKVKRPTAWDHGEYGGHPV